MHAMQDIIQLWLPVLVQYVIWELIPAKQALLHVQSAWLAQFQLTPEPLAKNVLQGIMFLNCNVLLVILVTMLQLMEPVSARLAPLARYLLMIGEHVGNAVQEPIAHQLAAQSVNLALLEPTP
jgi:hypothetical protein